MKKSLVFIFSLLLILGMAQGSFAKGNAGITFGYQNINIKAEYEAIGQEKTVCSSFFINMYGEYDIISNLSIAGNVNLKLNNSKKDDLDAIYFYSVIPSLFVKYDVYSFNKINLGLQLGLINDVTFDKTFTANTFFIVPGVYANIDLIPQLSLQADIKLPVFYLLTTTLLPGNTSGFFKAFFYDITLGITYKINQSFSAGIELNTSNSNYFGVAHEFFVKTNPDFKSGSYFAFSIGAKLVYNF